MKIVILDRDGVINYDSAAFIKSPNEWDPIPGSLEAIARLNRANFRVVLATNQSGIAKQVFDIEALNSIHALMHRQLAEVGGHIDAVFFCPCLTAADCECFKPRPGMLHEIAARLRIPLDDVPYVGDKRIDVEAARAAGAKPVLVRTGQGRETLRSGMNLDDVEVYDDLTSFVDTLVEGQAA